MSESMELRQARETAPDPQALVGTFRRFKSGGPVYQVLAVGQGGMAHIRVVESDEELDYPLAKIIGDDEE